MAGAPRTLTQRALNRALLARQALLERARAPLPAVLERIGGIQAQYAPSMYVGLWSRIAGFERAHLTRALERRTVVQGTLLRVTIHLVSARDYWPFAIAVRRARRQWWLRAHRRDLSADDLAAAAERLLPRLAEGPVPRRELGDLMGSSEVVNGVGLWVDLVRVPPSGTWERRRADLYASAEAWLGPPAQVTEEAGVDLLVRRYLQGFGPATAGEIADWAGLKVGAITDVLGRLRLRHFRAEDGNDLVDLPRAPLPDPDTPAPVRFLPTWDATLLVHARRSGILREVHRQLVFNTKTPHSVSTFLVDGVVAGTWRYERGAVHVEPFERLGAPATRAVRKEADRLATLYE